MDEYSPRQLSALLSAALLAPLAVICAGSDWRWVLAAAAVAGGLLYYIVWLSRRLPPHEGYAQILYSACGRAGGAALGLYWIWLVLLLGLAAKAAAGAFPQDRAFPLVPLVLLGLAAMVCRKGAAAVCRFGSTLFLLVVALLGATLAFGAADVQWENLRVIGPAAEGAGPLAVLLLPASGLFLRDRLRGSGGSAGWYLLTAAMAAAVSAVTVGILGRALAQAAPSPFWLMSRSISVLGIMERFESLISALLAVSFCCLLAALLASAQKALAGALPLVGSEWSVWLTAAAAVGSMWLVDRLPVWIWPLGNLIFWGIVPILTLGIVRQKIFQEK